MAVDAATLNDAIALQSGGIRLWVAVLVATNLAAVLFITRRTTEKWTIQWEPLAILGSFFLAGMMMTWLYDQYGYTRLLGLAHLVCWTPIYAWIALRRKQIAPADSWFGKYLIAYLVINGISLIIDMVDVVRYFSGTA